MRMIDADTLIDLINRVEMRYDISGDPLQETREQIFAHAWGMYKAIIEEMIYDQPTLTQPNEWVSVEERLPDKPGHYLVCTNVNYWHGGCMDKNGASSNAGTTDGYAGTTLSVLDCFYDITGDWNRVCNAHVTHWMNIPAPPGAVAKNETTESNEPLTPEELRKMLGEPVWTVGVSYTNDGKWAMWDIVEKADDEGVDFGYSTEGREWWNYNLRGNDGKLLNCAWACYRRPPEGEEET